MKIQGLFFGLLCIFSISLANRWEKPYPVQNEQKVEWEVDPLNSQVKFVAQNIGLFNVDGEFLNYEGTIYSDSADFTNPDIRFTIFTNSITTDNEKRDKHLKSKDFLYVEKYPEIRFESQKFEKVSDNKYVLIGILTILDHSRSEYFQVTRHVNDATNSNLKTQSFRITGEIDRQLYGLRFKEGISDELVGDKVEIDISIRLIRLN